ncbi:MAG: response regulator [Lachnospiraceae bacterium]|nr:response regulator [Lachnospiraceae bacterium]
MEFVNSYVISAMLSLILFGMGMTAMILGLHLFRENMNSSGGRKMFFVFVCVFIWDLGYAWMGLSYNSSFAYVARAIALAGVFMYMPSILEYTGYLAGHPRRGRIVFYVIYGIPATISWFNLIGGDTVSFEMTGWGYWYTTNAGWPRYLQFACIIAAIGYYYLILRYWYVRIELKRESMIIRRFMWFSPVVFAGYIFDTLIPIVLHTAAVPGSAITAFVSALMLYSISLRYKAFGISESNVSEYVFRDVGVPVLVMDWKGRIELWNREAARYFNKTGNELLGLTRSDLVSLPAEDFILTGIGGEEIFVTNDRRLYCEFVTTEIFDEFHEPLYTICFIRDMTDTQNALRMMDEGRRIAEAANRSKSAFLANMSHEIRTPMNAIIGMSDILLQNPEIRGDEQQQVMNIREAGESLLGIINDVLDISKIEAGRYDLVENPYKLADMVNAVSSIIRMRICNTSLEYIVDIDPEMPEVLIGDELRVRQILINLLGNSVKFTERGFIRLAMHGIREGDNYRVYVDVEDSGIGIREADIARIFEAFNQVDTRRNRSSQGTGLGLSIALRLSQAMGGGVTVESEYGKGTVFHLEYLQKVDAYEPIGSRVCEMLKRDDYEYAAEERRFDYKQHPSKKVLVVDDSKVNLMVAKGLLAPYGMDVDLVGSGRKCLENVAATEYDLIFMDHMMPEMDGVDTTRAIRALGGYNATVPIVALTANAIDGTREQLMKEGMQDFITKPINKLALNEVIEKYC